MLEEIEKRAKVKRQQKNSVSLKLVPVVLQSVTPQEDGKGERVGVMCQLTVVHKQRQMYNQFFELVLTEQLKSDL